MLPLPVVPRSLLLASAAFAVACAPPTPSASPPPAQLPTLEQTSSGFVYSLGATAPAARTEISAPPDRAWGALVGAYSALGLTATVIDTRTRTYGVQRFTQPRLGGTRTTEYVRCAFEGTGPSSVGGYRTQLSIISVLTPSGKDATTLAVEVTGFATSVEGTSTPPARCASTGELERRIQALVRERLEG
jgi:hypothetical protein